MRKPSKAASQKEMMTEAHKQALKELEANRHENGHKERVDAFNAMITKDLGEENVTFLLRSYD